jgi:hypothetical protein
VRRVEKKRPPAPVLTPADREKVDRAVQPIEEEALRAALDRLGQAIVSSGSRTKA